MVRERVALGLREGGEEGVDGVDDGGDWDVFVLKGKEAGPDGSWLCQYASYAIV